MPKTARKRPRPIIQLLAFGIATLVALLLAEVALRLFVSPSPQLGRIGYADATGAPVADLREAAARGLVVPVPAKTPRPRYMFACGLDFYLTYTDNDVLQRDWLDDNGRVENHINAHGIRERDEITPDKPAGQRRIVCVGDSFTYGWGIRPEHGWVRLLEDELRRDQLDVRTVNCGAAGSVCVDEYWYGLKHRFHAFQPDAVVLTICLNDLVGSDGVTVIDPVPTTGSRLIDLSRAALGRGPLDLDPGRDWVDELMAMPEIYPDGTANPRFGPDKPFEAMWDKGVPQASLRAAQTWCDERKLPFMVILWPFLQGLGKGRHYPFQKLHDLVAADCEQAGIAFLDVLPALANTDQEDLWVTPADPHPNPLAQRLVVPSITRFVRDHSDW